MYQLVIKSLIDLLKILFKELVRVLNYFLFIITRYIKLKLNKVSYKVKKNFIVFNLPLKRFFK